MFHLLFHLWNNSFRLKGPRETRNRDAYEWVDMAAMRLDVSRLGLSCLVWQYLDGYRVNHSAGRACIICSAENEFSLGWQVWVDKEKKKIITVDYIDCSQQFRKSAGNTNTWWIGECKSGERNFLPGFHCKALWRLSKVYSTWCLERVWRIVSLSI